MNRTTLIAAALCLVGTSHAPAAVAAVRIAIEGAEADSPLSAHIPLGSQPLGSIQAFVAQACFFEEGSPSSSCDAGGMVSVQQEFAPPFFTAGIFRKTLATGAVVPVAAPVTLAPGQSLIMVNDWIASALGPVTGTQILGLTSPGEPFEEVVVTASGTGIEDGLCPFPSQGFCLAGGRFRVRAHFVTSRAAEGSASGLALTADTGYFFFFDPANVEAILKVLDGCALNQRYWVFAGGLTDVRTEITVTDVETGSVRVYVNPLGSAFQPVQDTAAFATCP